MDDKKMTQSRHPRDAGLDFQSQISTFKSDIYVIISHNTFVARTD